MPRTATGRRSPVLAAAWDHRWGTLAWVLGAGLFLVYFGVAYAAPVRTFAGGAAAFGASVGPVAEGMRPLNGLAERLDTYGGYVTYHNTGGLAIGLALWALIQGLAQCGAGRSAACSTSGSRPDAGGGPSCATSRSASCWR
jgi:hypothetical protein